MVSKLITFIFLLWPGLLVSGQACDSIFNPCPEGQTCDEELGQCSVLGEGPIDTPPAPAQQECDAIFGDCDPREVAPPTPPEQTPCYSINDIDSDIFTPDTRQAVNVCGAGDCADFADYDFSCAPIWTCKNQRIITDGKGIIDVRSSLEEEEQQCSSNSGTIDVTDKKCPKADEVCCKRPNYRAKKCDKFSKPTPKPTPNPKDPSDSKEPSDPTTDWAQCGRNGTGKIVLSGIENDSNTAQPGEFPHMCVIYRTLSGQRVYVGGASLIGPNKLLTVAHKFWVVNKGTTVDHRDKINPRNSEFKVRCGEHNVKAESELFDWQETKVVAIRFHPDYDFKRVTYNFAILITEENFVYQQHIGPVCLPDPDEEFSGDKNCWSSGWGADAYGSAGFFSDTLKKVKMPIVAKDECEKKFRSHPRFEGKGFNLHKSWICVGGEKNSDTCNGDGGSPHVCIDKEKKYVQVGSVAWGIDCGQEIPAVYSNVAGSMCWIDWIMSCVPLSEYYIDSNSFDGDLRGSGASFKSANNLTSTQCGDWLKNKPDLNDECSIAYEQLDNRSVDQRSSTK